MTDREFIERLHSSIVGLADGLTAGGVTAYSALGVEMVRGRSFGFHRDDTGLPESGRMTDLRSAAEHIRKAFVAAGEDFDYQVDELFGGVNGPVLMITQLYSREDMRRRDDEFVYGPTPEP